MPDEYPANEGVRLRSFCDAEAVSGRLFLCAGCRDQVIIWSCCDRGQIYCNRGCAAAGTATDPAGGGAAGQRYQASQRGRLRHAATGRGRRK